MSRISTMAVVCLIASTGCVSKLEEQTKPTGSIIGKKTQDIAEFDPNAKQEVSDSTFHTDDPILGSMEAYGPTVEKISKMKIDMTVRTFEAINGRYPKDHDEFMAEIIKANNIKLPVLPAKWKYAYDVANHELKVVRAIPEKTEKKKD